MSFDFSQLPRPNDRRIALHVRPAAERALRDGHPWLFDEAITQQRGEGPAGDLAVIFDRKDRFMAIGLYDPHSHIRVRVLHHGTSQRVDVAWLRARFAEAVALRRPIELQDTTGYRVIYGEGDGLSGLIVDRYEDTAVIKLYSHAWIPYLEHLGQFITDLLPIERVVLRMSRLLQRDLSLLHGLYDGLVLVGERPQSAIVFRENGLYFAADVIRGHKTGFFFDQRENREMVRTLTAGKTVLDVFSYVGAFSLYAAAGGARAVTSVDISEPAMRAARANFALNVDNAHIAAAEHITRVGDAFEVMRKLYDAGKRYDVVIVDPPSFAKRASEVPDALSAYEQLTELGSRLVAAGGVLVMASCSSRISSTQFFDTVNYHMHAEFVEFARRGHALDHPVRFSEGDYLKCLFARRKG